MSVTILSSTAKFETAVQWSGTGTGFVPGCVVSRATLVNNGLVQLLSRSAPIQLTTIAGSVPLLYNFSADLIFGNPTVEFLDSDQVVDNDLTNNESPLVETLVGASVAITITNGGKVQQLSLQPITEV